MTFAKGQSGNPGGRPKSVEGQVLRDLARVHTSKAIEVLVTIMESEEAPEPARVGACNSILDRGWGKPKQEIEHNANSDLIDMIHAARARLDV